MSNTTNPIWLRWLCVAVFASVSSQACHTLAERPTADEGEHSGQARSVEELLLARRSTLRELLGLVKSEFRAGVGTLEAVLHTTRLLNEAELQLAKTGEDRVTIYESTLKGFQQLEKTAKALNKLGRVPMRDVLRVRGERLEVEMELAREKRPMKLP